jgi:hypothetical protein
VEVEHITTSLLNDTLRAWRQVEEIPAGLLELDILRQQASSSRVEIEIRLRDLIESLVAGELAGRRAAEGLPTQNAGRSRAELLAAVAGDFSRNHSEIEAWSALYHRFLAPTPLSVEELALAAHLDARNFRRRVDGGVRRLTEQLRRLEMAEHNRLCRVRLGRHLPPPEYAKLFGVTDLKHELGALLRQESGPDFVSIEGMGGGGKTALARATAFELAENSDLDGIAWVSARQTWLTDRGAIETAPDAATSLADIVNKLTTQLGLAELAGLSIHEKLERLAGFLSSARHLIIIDNLESISDVDSLLPALMPLARPTRFLLTSRQTLSHYPTVTRLPVPPLSLDDSQALVESELRRRGRDGALKPDDMAALYEVVGGAPLALKLVAAQMSRWPLPILLDNLRHARQRAPENLYTFIYRRSWLALSDPARQLLLSLLTIAPDGEDIEWLRLMSFMPPDEFDDALALLLSYSLLEAAGPPDSPRYRLHRLTTTFLQTEVLSSWEGTTAPPDPNAK